jgi:hypothetical protein
LASILAAASVRHVDPRPTFLVVYRSAAPQALEFNRTLDGSTPSGMARLIAGSNASVRTWTRLSELANTFG